jgi:hypothetical protein
MKKPVPHPTRSNGGPQEIIPNTLRVCKKERLGFDSCWASAHLVICQTALVPSKDRKEELRTGSWWSTVQGVGTETCSHSHLSTKHYQDLFQKTGEVP